MRKCGFAIHRQHQFRQLNGANPVFGTGNQPFAQGLGHVRLDGHFWIITELQVDAIFTHVHGIGRDCFVERLHSRLDLRDDSVEERFGFRRQLTTLEKCIPRAFPIRGGHQQLLLASILTRIGQE